MSGRLSMSLLIVHEGTATSAASPCVLVTGNGGRRGKFREHDGKSSCCGSHPRQRPSLISVRRQFGLSCTLGGGVVHGSVCG